MAAIKAATYTLDHGSARETKARQEIDALAILDRQVDQLVRLVDDLLEVSRIRTGKITLRLEPVDLEKVLRQAIETAQPELDRGRHTLKVDLPNDQIVLRGDLVRLIQVFANLLNNAAKYTDPNGKIELSAERFGREAIVTVRDNGIGIPSDMLPHIFDFFTQVDGGERREKGGLGIGLGLVRDLVKRHGGSVEAKSDGQGRGSTFTVRLPIFEDGPP
ncbi:HAMP domain-containing histidine kinase (plasmid) [Methylocystis parvus OBBP]|uniref:histidine kinase n=1 Tax=Methylocystis parvus TaxID=134 RepID=A0A6B8MC38_9HYPH|nr:HAMP domain-containing sensor histidine kinase [Methylocystis parvus]QGM99955.1 HAMP domain-containing histidine kinase [Methylocystis parvus]WBK02182.1 HAMP domain-containing histidine kinase [Methylocystis parvus OBBP]